MKEFYTRIKANEGRVLPLFLPTGEATKHSLTIAGIDSDTFRNADAHNRRAVLDLDKELTVDERTQAVEDLRIDLIASTVISWTFEDKCTRANVVKLFKEAPQICEAVNQYAANRKAFFA